jgi:hypothetical protein
VRADELTLGIPEGRYVIEYDKQPINLLPLASANWRILTAWGSERQVKITMRWPENGEQYEETQTVFLD